MIEAIVNIPNDPIVYTVIMALIVTFSFSAAWAILIRYHKSESFQNPHFVNIKKVNDSSDQKNVIPHNFVIIWISKYIKRKDRPSAADSADHLISSL
ncbi:hypothetical protein [Scopulibacillus cellulosilyticus]|uniref:Uncharacterized protein n=1 Tax=Scopulibacillus cellulosilyticus TaxID=2665665 RepID=A0ABW2Q053_9BACL